MKECVHRNDSPGPHVAAQVAAAWSCLDAASRSEALGSALSSQDRAFLDALREMQKVRDFVGRPEAILGSPATKHGEIAEQVHVGVKRAFDALQGQAPSATFEGVPRTGPVDYIDSGIDVQSKYINGIRNTLDHVLGHAEKYPDFAQSDGIYNIPSDQANQLDELRRTGAIEGLSEKSARTIQRKLDEIQAGTGRSPEAIIEPGEATYGEVQKGKVHETLDNREQRLSEKNEDLKKAASVEHGPSLAGLGTAAAMGAAAGGGVRLAQSLFVKWKDGKNMFHGDFDAADWRDVGVETAKGAGSGGIAGGALYLVTNSTDLAAPFAGSLVSGLMGVGELLMQYHQGDMTADQFVEMSQLVVADAAIVGLASAVGQAVIPIPVIGALVGSLAGKLVASALQDAMGQREAELISKLKAFEERAYAKLDAEFKAFIDRLDQYFGNLERIGQVAFNESVNTALRLTASTDYALAVGVGQRMVIHTTDDLDAFMLK